jgi:pimeloyl-ACP methyl ester carboxylesterase
MPLIHHVVTGQGHPPIVFVHGFGCAHSDWDAQVARHAGGSPCGGRRLGRWQPVRSSDGSRVEGDVYYAGRIPDAYRPLVPGKMFTTNSDPAVVAAVVERAGHLPRAIGEKVLLDAVRYDTGHLATSLANLRVPVLAIQTTYSNERRERRSMSVGQNTPYLEMLLARVTAVRVEIIPGTGHFPQIDEPDRTNSLIDGFIAALPTRPSDQP